MALVWTTHRHVPFPCKVSVVVAFTIRCSLKSSSHCTAVKLTRTFSQGPFLSYSISSTRGSRQCKCNELQRSNPESSIAPTIDSYHSLRCSRVILREREWLNPRMKRGSTVSNEERERKSQVDDIAAQLLRGCGSTAPLQQSE